MKNFKAISLEAAALIVVFSSAMSGPAAAESRGKATDWTTADASYRLNSGFPGGVSVSEFTPTTAPDFTCIVVQSAADTIATMSCLPKSSSEPRIESPR